jgi:sugar (pentulose or hexulose) kinase
LCTDRQERSLLEKVLIWSDSRATTETEELFELIPEDDWYLKTGNGFLPSLYTVFKIIWLRKNRPDIYVRTDKILGTKDNVNFRLTGRIAQETAALGAGALAAMGCGLWNDFSTIRELHQVEDRSAQNPTHAAFYDLFCLSSGKRLLARESLAK